MIDVFTTFLLHYKKKTILLDDLLSLSHQHKLKYDEFAEIILKFEHSGVLDAVKKQGRTTRKPSLAYTYRIKNNKLKEDYFQRLQRARSMIDPRITLDPYFKLPVNQFEVDEPYLLKITEFLKINDLPTTYVPAPERSYQLVGNEKWISDLGGEELLKRIALFRDMKIFPVADPLMLAVDTKKSTNSVHLHLIVENKTTYQGLLPVLMETIFTTLIYGSGRKILRGMEQFHNQLLLDGDHRFYYFGDLDLEGINIWYELSNTVDVVPALPFYIRCLESNSVPGKTNQRKVETAIERFSSFFEEGHSIRIKDMLETGHYLPQEVLKTSELQMIWGQWS